MQNSNLDPVVAFTSQVAPIIPTSMPFDSKLFFAFLAVVLAVHHTRAIPWTIRRTMLLLFSYGFYSSWTPAYLPFLVFSTAIDWQVSRKLAVAQTGRKRLLAISIGLNLGLLGYFKYGAFFVSLVRATEVTEPSFVPLGISFFTFQTMAYTIDVYRRRTGACLSFRDFALYVSFFPQLMAGPIVRAGKFLQQIESPPRPGRIAWGLGSFLILLGLFLKSVVADGIFGPIATTLYECPEGTVPTPIDHLVGIYAFWGQLYADFSGYSNLAVGVGLMLGIVLPDNFHCPHAATSIGEFWRRWHMTLTRWFGDYVYKPLGGRRVSPLLAVRNVVTVMLLVGLWHGAALTFVLWGLLNALLLIGERKIHRAGIQEHIPPIVRAVFVFLLVGQTCALFRAHDLAHAFSLYQGIVGVLPGSTPVFGAFRTVLCLGALATMFGVQWVMRNRRLATALDTCPSWARGVVMTTMLAALWILGGNRSAYIYFAF